MSSPATSSSFRVSRFVWLLAAVIIAIWLMYLVRGALVPFIIGGALAYILDPLVTLLDRLIPWTPERNGLKRILLIFAVFAISAIIVTGIMLLLIPPLITEFKHFVDVLPNLIEQARATVEGWDAQIDANLPEEVHDAAHDALQNIGSLLVGAAQGFAVRTLGVITQTLTVVLGLAIVPLFLFYMLKDREEIMGGVLSIFPPSPRVHARNIITILNNVFSSYVRSQILLGVVVGVMVFIGLVLLGVPHAPILALVAGIFELVPIIGPWLGAVPGILVVLALAPEKLIWVAMVYLIVQLLENSLLVPRIHSHSLNVHPIMIMAVIVVGSEIAGLWGVVLGPPLMAASKQLFFYVQHEWHLSHDAPPEPQSESAPPADADIDAPQATAAVNAPSDSAG